MNCPVNFLIAGKIKSTFILLSSFITVKVTIKLQQPSYLGKQEVHSKIQEIKENLQNFIKIKTGIDWEVPDREPGKERWKVNEKLRLRAWKKMRQKGTDDGKESDGRNGVAELTI